MAWSIRAGRCGAVAALLQSQGSAYEGSEPAPLEGQSLRRIRLVRRRHGSKTNVLLRAQVGPSPPKGVAQQQLGHRRHAVGTQHLGRLAGHEESPGQTVEVDGRRHKAYYGSASDFTSNTVRSSP
jgi:hypothetical protein